jgi:hypothetical protein
MRNSIAVLNYAERYKSTDILPYKKIKKYVVQHKNKKSPPKFR